MATEFLSLFDAEQRDLATKVLDYYDGKSKKYLLDHLTKYRANALTKGMQAHTINVVKEVVDKSGMLFSGRPPVLNVFPVGAENVEVDDDASQRLQYLFEQTGWIEFFNNLDPVVRLLKTAFLFVQYDATTKQLFFTPLTQANCAVNVVNREIETLIYYTGERDGVGTYRIWTADLVQDLEVTNDSERITSTMDNPYGFIPIVPNFHDTNVPREGAWNPTPDDLIHINDIYNLHITDGSYAIQHAKLQTLFTNAQIQGSGTAITGGLEDYGSKLGPRWVDRVGVGAIGGPSEAVAIETVGDQGVYLEYKGPSPDIEPLDNVIRGWFRDYARAWNVSIEEEGGFGAADSGFKLVVKELPNKELRLKRQRMFEAGFKKLYEVLLRINDVFDLGLIPNTELYVEFSEPQLPVDEKVSEETWDVKINAGRATIITYFVEQHGMSREEAIKKAQELAEDRAILAALTTMTTEPTDEAAITPQ